MSLATWWSPDPLTLVQPLAGLHVARADSEPCLAEVNGIDPVEVRARLRDGHRPYLAALGGEPVAYGWVATRTATIGELRLTFALPPRQRYLWDFATLPAWQGRGIYPRLLQAIVLAEVREADRFWILHAPENTPSGAGMSKAGFAPVGRLSVGDDRLPRLAPSGDAVRARAGAALLGVELAQDDLAPCWRCSTGGESPAACSCRTPGSADPGTCSCALPLKTPVIRVAWPLATAPRP